MALVFFTNLIRTQFLSKYFGLYYTFNIFRLVDIFGAYAKKFINT